MSPIRPGLRPAALFATLVLATVVGGCKTDNPNFCGNGDTRPECTGVDAAIDGAAGCMAMPALCTADQTCAADDICVDCTVGNNHQSADCTSPATSVCDTTRACRACAADTECDSKFCDHGACAPAAQVLFVRPDGNDVDNNCLAIATPCKTVTHALGEVPTSGAEPNTSRRYIKLMTAATYVEPGVVMIDDKTVVIVGAPVVGTERSVLDRTNNGITMEIKGGADVRLERLAVANATGNAATGIFCREDAKLVADNIEVTNNTGLGIEGNTCVLTLRNSIVSRSVVGGVSVTAARVVIVNNVIVDNGGNTTSSFGGLRIDVGVDPTSVIQSNTIVGNHAAVSDGVTCIIPELTILNSIIHGDGLKARVSGACVFDHTLYGPDDPGNLLGTTRGNMAVPMLASFMFQAPADYHIKAGSVARGKGTLVGLAPEAAKDLDGQPRPQGAPDVGADEIPD